MRWSVARTRTGLYAIMGAQAGHNVVTADGRHHTFSQFGAGTFIDGVRTLLGPDFVVHPLALLIEAERLSDIGCTDALRRLVATDQIRVITHCSSRTTSA